MNRKEFIEATVRAAETLGYLHDNGIIDAKDALASIADCVVESLREWRNESIKSLSEYSTKELYEELLRREGIREIQVGMGERVEIFDNRGSLNWVEGPSRLLINID
jgi:hypothetical protein